MYFDVFFNFEVRRSITGLRDKDRFKTGVDSSKIILCEDIHRMNDATLSLEFVLFLE